MTEFVDVGKLDRDIIHVKPTPSIFRLDHSLQPRVASLNLAATGRARKSIYIRI